MAKRGKPLSAAHKRAISEGLKRFHKTGGKGPSTKGRADIKEAMQSFREWKKDVPAHAKDAFNKVFSKPSHIKDYVRGARRAIGKRT